MDSLSRLARHVAETLPDSISERKELLTALAHVVTEGHPALVSIHAQLASLETIERLQSELPFKFQEVK